MIPMKKGRRILYAVMIAAAILGGCAEAATLADNQHEDSKEVFQEEDVVTIEGHIFTKDDLAFYTLMEKIKIELARAEETEQLKADALAEGNAYWDDKVNQYENINVQLQGLIDIYAMSLLAEEKHYFIPIEKLEEEEAAFESAVAESEKIEELIQRYGEKEYAGNLREYLRQSMLRNRVADDLKKDVLEENPEASKQEINYLVSQKYDELYMDHVAGLELEIHIK